MRCLFFLSLLIYPALGYAEEEQEAFDISQLPRGVVLTLPHEVSSQAPVSLHLRVNANDRKQVLKISLHPRAQNPGGVKLHILDQNSNQVQQFHVKPGASAFYYFRNLTPIRLVPQPDKTNKSWAMQRLLLESNLPLGVSHENGQSLATGLSDN